ncbi:MAG TPA: hypothetical protein VF831_09795 [Anaerolineales bacterium]
MNRQTEKTNRLTSEPTTTRCIWVTLEPSEVIELKRIAMDDDMDEAISFFCDVLVPRVRTTASQRGVAQEMFIKDNIDEHISG